MAETPPERLFDKIAELSSDCPPLASDYKDDGGVWDVAALKADLEELQGSSSGPCGPACSRDAGCNNISGGSSSTAAAAPVTPSKDVAGASQELEVVLQPEVDEWASTDDEEVEPARSGFTPRKTPRTPQQRTPSQTPRMDGTRKASSRDETALVHVPGFVPALEFTGKRAGMCFKRGAAGLGYYPDTPPEALPLDQLLSKLSTVDTPEGAPKLRFARGNAAWVSPPKVKGTGAGAGFGGFDGLFGRSTE